MTGEIPPERPLKDRCGALIEELRNQADKCADTDRGPVHGSDYGNGVSAGLNYSAEELEALLDGEEP